MTATQRTTDRSRSVTTACSPRRTQRHRARPNPHMGCSNPSRLRASALTLTNRPQTPAKTTRPTRVYCTTAPAASRRLDPPPLARSLSLCSSLSSAHNSLLSPPLQSVICPTTALLHTRPSTLHQLLPVPRPDPARA